MARAGDAEEGVEQRGDSTPVAKLASPDLEGVVLEREGGVHWGEDALGGGARAGKKGNHGVILCAQGGLMTGKRVLGGERTKWQDTTNHCSELVRAWPLT